MLCWMDWDEINVLAALIKKYSSVVLHSEELLNGFMEDVEIAKDLLKKSLQSDICLIS